MSFNSKKRVVSTQRRRQLNRQKSKAIGRRQSQFIQEIALLEDKNV